MGNSDVPSAEGVRLRRIDADLLTPIVRESLGKKDASVTGWNCELIKGDGSDEKRLVCRVFGTATAGRDQWPWSVFLKVPEPTHLHYNRWNREPLQREVMLFRSGILEDLPAGMVAPRCLSITEFPDDEPWMWLEHIAGTPSFEWPIDRFGLMAYHLGCMNGVFMDGTHLPDHEWLDNSATFRERLQVGVKESSLALAVLETNPLTHNLYGSDFGQSLLRLVAEREHFFDALEQVPKTLVHGDFCYSNVFDCDVDGGDPVTGVIDWQYCGIRQIGFDIAGFIADSSVMPVRRKAAEPELFAEIMLENYLRGIEESGWRGDMRKVRFACLTYLAIPWTFYLLPGVGSKLEMKADTADDLARQEQLVEEFKRRQGFLLSVCEEARSLMEEVIDL